MSDKDFKVKNKLQVKGITSAGPVVSDASGNLDSTAYVATQYGGTGTSTSPSSGQILYSSSGTTYAPTTLTSLDVKGASYSADAPSSPVVGQIWVESDVDATTFDSNIIRRKTITSTAGQTVYVTDIAFIDGYEQVYLNGSLLVRSSDYTTSTNNTITLSTAAALNDIVEILSITNLNSVNAATLNANTFTADQTINSVAVGLGAGNIASNTRVGVSALNANTTGTENTAVGYLSSSVNTTGTFNTSVGFQSLNANATGSFNTAVGGNALLFNTSGNANVAVGVAPLRFNTIGQQNVAIGNSALRNNTAGSYNTGVGTFALNTNTTGVNNAAVGTNALYANTIGSSNTAVGYQSLNANTTGNWNTAFGSGAALLSVTDDVTAFGGGALGSLTTGTGNTAIGRAAAYYTSTGTSNTAIGWFALFENRTGYSNTAVGYQALRENRTGTDNLAVGVNALQANTTGVNNTSVGNFSLDANTTGYFNSAFGFNTLGANTVGWGNVAVGMACLATNTTGITNVAVGYSALNLNTTGSYNVGIGLNALANCTTGSRNIAMGESALTTITTANDNTAIGTGALYQLQSNAYQNTALGRLAGSSSLSGLNNTMIGYNAQPSSTSVNNTITLGDTSIGTLRCQVTSITALSDARDKKNIESLPVGLDLINSLTPVKFDWNMRDGGKIDVPDTGFIAQDLVEIEDSTGIADYLQLTYRDNPEKLEASYGRLIPILVKAVQELSAEVKDLRSQLND